MLHTLAKGDEEEEEEEERSRKKHFGIMRPGENTNPFTGNHPFTQAFSLSPAAPVSFNPLPSVKVPKLELIHTETGNVGGTAFQQLSNRKDSRSIAKRSILTRSRKSTRGLNVAITLYTRYRKYLKLRNGRRRGGLGIEDYSNKDLIFDSKRKMGGGNYTVKIRGKRWNWSRGESNR